MTREAPRVAASPRLPFLVAGGIAATALVLRIVDPGRGLPGLAPEALPLLFIAACLCAAALLLRRFPPGAWLSLVTAAGLSAVEVVGSVRTREAEAPAAVWPWLVGLAEAALVGAVLVAAAYAVTQRAGSPTSLGRAPRILVLVAVAGIALVALWTFVATIAGWITPATPATSGDLPPLRISGRLATAFVAIAAFVGLWRDLADPIRRARADARRTGDLPGALADQLFPTASGLRRRGREEERARLAADLHALVLPDLRRAAQAAEASGAAGEPLATTVRQALQGVERLMHERQSVVFEEFGLVAALEWLAERTQDQSEIEVAVELEGLVDDPDALPKDVARAAFRVAILAVDNAARHAAASRIELRLDVRGQSLRLAIADDGEAAPQAPVRGGRGLRDMRSAAADVGASVEMQTSESGTTVEFRWDAARAVAEEHATRDAATAARRDAPLP